MSASDLPAEAAELRRRVHRLTRLVKISVTLNSTLDVGRLLHFIIDSAADLVESEAASLMLFDEKTHTLQFAAATGSDPRELAKIPVPLEGSIAGTIFLEKRPMIIHDVATDSRHFRQVGERVRLETRSLIGVPMRIRDKVTGVLEAINKRQGTFTAADVQTLSIVASHAAVALQNARLVEALRRANQELGKLDKLKSDFISIASHELRTPLGLILGYASILKEEADAAASAHAVAVLNSALRMRGLIEDMTNMNLLRVGSAEFCLALQPLQPIIRAAHDEVSEMIRAKELSAFLSLPEEALSAMVDASKFCLALTNILNNAIHFTPPKGHIWVELDRRGSEALLKVRDDGVGIPPEELGHIFDQFYQVEDHLTRRHGGLGLGLAIVKAIIEGHGGRIWAESGGPGTGALFTIALPVRDV